MPIIARMPTLEFGPEWAALELSALGLTTPDQVAFFRELVQRADLQYGELLEQALRHKVLPRLAEHLLLHDVQRRLPARLRVHLDTSLAVHRHTIATMVRECSRVTECLDAAGVRFAFTKGIVFEQTLCKGIGSRAMSDIDCMIAPESRESVVKAMAGLGFQAGYYNRATRTIELERKTGLMYKLNPDHLPHFSRLVHDPVVAALTVDFANSLTWTNSAWDVPMSDVLAKIVQVPCAGAEGTLNALTLEYQLLFTILHLFREAWFERTIRTGTDVDLGRFSDIYHLFRLEEEAIVAGDFTALVCRLDIKQPVCWVLEHFDRTFGTDITSRLRLSGSVSESWLASAREPTQALVPWTGTMRQRLHAKDRLQLFSWTA